MNFHDWKKRYRVSKQKATQEGIAGYYSRGYLPHFDCDNLTQFVTFRLFDSLPSQVIESWQTELKQMSDDEAKIERFRRVELYLDKGYGACWLGDQRISEMVQNGLLYFQDKRYLLHAWCVMPNHVHVLITPQPTWGLDKIVHSWKSYMAHEANKILDRQGDFWMHEPFDRYIRDETHFHRVVHYIERNPVKAGLCKQPEDWKWSSASWRKRKP